MKKNKLFVSHGRVTHPLGAKCKFCERVEREFDRDLKSGKVAREIKKRRKNEENEN